MTFTTEQILLVASVLLFASIIAGKTGYKFGVPVLLIFLLVGMAFGSGGLGIQFSSSEAAQSVGIVALSIILFSGGMDTSIKEIKPILSPGLVLSTLGVLLTTILTGFFIFWATNLIFNSVTFSLTVSLLLAATMSSTDSASVFAILRSKNLHLKHNLRPMLELESGSNDPMAYMLTIVLIQVVNTNTFDVWTIISSLLIQFSVGSICGYLIGKLASRVINKINIGNQALYPILLLAFIFFAFSFTDLLGGNGYLAVYIAGLVVGNSKLVFKKSLTTFYDGFAWLFQVIMFLTLGLLVNPPELMAVAWPAIVIGVFMILIARPLTVFLCLAPFRKITLSSKVFVSWVGLRGAVPIIFATYPVLANVPGGSQIFNIVFFITIISLLVQGTSVGFVAKFLKLDHANQDNPRAFTMDLPDELETFVSEMEVTRTLLAEGCCLRDIPLPDHTLVVMIKRGKRFLVPNGTTELLENDKMLIISDKEEELHNFYNHIGLEEYPVYSSTV